MIGLEVVGVELEVEADHAFLDHDKLAKSFILVYNNVFWQV